MLKFSYSSRWTTRTDRGVPISSRSVIVPAELELSTDFESALSTSFFKRREESGRPDGSVMSVLDMRPRPSAGIEGAPPPAPGRSMLKADAGALPRGAANGAAPRSARKLSSRDRGDGNGWSPARAAIRAA